MQAFKAIITDLEKLILPKRKCCECGKRSDRDTMFAVNGITSFCDVDCAAKYAYKNKEKGKKIKHRQQKKESKLNDKSYRKKCAQQAFNAYIRYRDNDDNCISCGRDHDGQYHAGHYRSTGAYPELRFEELNCHKQCAPCNNHLSGNIANYRIGLIERIGHKAVEWLEGPHEPKKYTCDDFLVIEKKYKQKLKELKEANE